MTRKSRRDFLASTALVSATIGMRPATTAVAGQTQRHNRAIASVNGNGIVKGNPFAAVHDIEDSLRSYSSEQYKLPFDDEEYTNRLHRCRDAMSKLNIDLLWVTCPE